MMHCLGRHMVFCCAVTTNGHHVQVTYIHVHGCSILAISTILDSQNILKSCSTPTLITHQPILQLKFKWQMYKVYSICTSSAQFKSLK